MPPAKTQTDCHCSEHQDVVAIIAIATEARDNTLLIIRALYGNLGESGGEGLGLVARVIQLERRVVSLEEVWSGAKSGTWQAFIQLLPWLVIVFIAGVFVLQRTGVIK